MNRHIRILLAGTAVASALAVPSQAEMSVKVTAPDGSASQLPLTTATRITFLPGGVDVEGAGAESVSLPYALVQSISFMDTPSGASAITADGGLRLRRNPVEGILEVVGHNGTPSSLGITSAGGVRVREVRAWKGEPLDVSSLAPGVYLLTIDKTTIKFIKK